ncbi:MAG TPA: isoprenylcysteine carboxylmethyltransferase family protein [Candidatus Krumholzibacteria bacterium]|nr:isoprenylcysteine carboxylmethyltransferase family protein [Candidatus Krumholzibacteria bacterium]
MRNPPTRLLPPGYFLLSLVTIAVASWLLPGSPPAGTLFRWLALPPFVIGVALFVFTVANFKRTRTPLRPLKEAGVLMTGGTFRFSRNPIYLGMTLVLMAAAIYSGVPYLFVVPLLFAVIIQKRFIELEEEFLTEHFGDAYLEYRKRVRRWL